MLLSDDLVRVRLKIGVKTSAPSSVSENMSLRGGGLDGRHRLPMAIWISLAPTMVRGDEDLDAIRPSGGEYLPHMLDNIVRLECRAAEFVELAPLRQKVVVGIDDKQTRQFRFVSQLRFRHTGTPFVPIYHLERGLAVQTLDEPSNCPGSDAPDMLDRDPSQIPGRCVGRRETGAGAELRRDELVEEFRGAAL